MGFYLFWSSKILLYFSYLDVGLFKIFFFGPYWPFIIPVIIFIPSLLQFLSSFKCILVTFKRDNWDWRDARRTELKLSTCLVPNTALVPWAVGTELGVAPEHCRVWFPVSPWTPFRPPTPKFKSKNLWWFSLLLGHWPYRRPMKVLCGLVPCSCLIWDCCHSRVLSLGPKTERPKKRGSKSLVAHFCFFFFFFPDIRQLGSQAILVLGLTKQDWH